MKKLMMMLMLCLVAGVQADVFFTVSEEMEDGEGWMNVTEATDCSTYLFGNAWANPDLRATPSGTITGGDYKVLLQANTNGYDDNAEDPYWVDQVTLLGNKCMEANYYTEVDGLDGETIVYKYRVLSNNLEVAGYKTQAFIKVLDAAGGWATTQEVYLDLEVGVGSLTLDVTTGTDPRVQCGFVIQGLTVSGTSAEAALGVEVVPFRDRATAPDPADDSDVPLNLASLSWVNADPNDPADIISCTVYFEKDPSNGADPNFYSAAVAAGITDQTLVLADAGVTLVDDGIPYKWRVDCIDPNSGGLTKILTGDVWHFSIGDVPPVVDAGDNQYLWIDMADGDGDSGKVTFNLSGTYTDDGRSTITRAEWVQGTHEGGGTVTIESQDNSTPGVVDAVVSATNNGWLFLTLEVEDASGSGSDTLNVGVYGTCIEAANEDPDDPMYQNYLHGDIDGDCDTDLNDFAILAGTWLDCMTSKAGCTP